MEVITKQIKSQSGEEQLVYEAKCEGEGSISLFASAFKNQEPALTEEQAEKLFSGKTVETELSYRRPDGELGAPSPCSIVPLSIEDRNKQAGRESFENRVLKVGVAWHLLKKEDQSLYGYKVFNKRASGGNGAPVQFFKNALIGDDETVELKPKHCFELIEQGETAVFGKQISYHGEVRNGKSGEVLKVQRARLRKHEPS